MQVLGSNKVIVLTGWFTYWTLCAVAVIYRKNSFLRSKLTVGLNDHKSTEVAASDIVFTSN